MDWDDAYAVAKHISGGEHYPDHWRDDANAFRKKLTVQDRARIGVMYGHGPRTIVDVFNPGGTPKGLFVFVHGGFWQMLDGSYWSHFAQGALDQGWAVAVPTYDLCPRVRISDITGQITQAISVIARDIAGPIRLAGHSAGGHLVARMVTPGGLSRDIRDRVEKCVPISPLSDLRPLLKTKMNEDFQLTEATAAAESPALMDRPDLPVTVWVGEKERPAFLDQARWLAEAWQCEHVVEPGKHHFDVIDGLQHADSPLMVSILQGAP